MSKYDQLWKKIGEEEREEFSLTFGEIEEILSFPIDHSFLSYKKELIAYGYEVGRISMKNKTVAFRRLH
ncbi:MAG: hypothetical protein KBS81_08135 [Spirochaetales bacterium]|nr:hypothetical protein [Candidatus Physcosoma equi]